jgi:outer membrane lipoprotein SlyB
MATRLTKSGLQSYQDPFQRIKKSRGSSAKKTILPAPDSNAAEAAAAKAAADARNLATYGTKSPTQSMILKRMYEAQEHPEGLTAEGVSTTKGEKQLAAEQKAQEELLNMGAVPNMTLDENGNPLDIVSALGAGVGGAAGGAALGAGIGAGVGSVVPGVGTAVGAAAGGVIGGISGFIGGALVKMSSDEKQNVKEAYAVYSAAKGNMARILNNLNQGLTSPQQAKIDWNNEKAYVYAAEKNLKQKTDSNLDDFLGKPREELSYVEAFIRLMPDLDVDFQMALMSPNANRLAGFAAEPEVVE